VEGGVSVAVVFDLDGTLVDSMPDIAAAVNRMLAGIGEHPMDRSEVQTYVGNGAPTLVRRVLAARGVTDDRRAGLFSAFLADYTAHSSDLSAPYPEVPETLTRLAKDGHRLAVCTNKPADAARAMLDALDLSRHFGVVIGAGTLPQMKPDPAPLLGAINELGGGPALFVGDSEVDLHCGANARVPVALFDGGYLRDPAALPLAAFRFGRFSELPALVKSLP
jgi:phosphoglycolate phosphatase